MGSFLNFNISLVAAELFFGDDALATDISQEEVTAINQHNHRNGHWNRSEESVRAEDFDNTRGEHDAKNGMDDAYY